MALRELSYYAASRPPHADPWGHDRMGGTVGVTAASLPPPRRNQSELCNFSLGTQACSLATARTNRRRVISLNVGALRTTPQNEPRRDSCSNCTAWVRSMPPARAEGARYARNKASRHHDAQNR